MERKLRGISITIASATLAASLFAAPRAGAVDPPRVHPIRREAASVHVGSVGAGDSLSWRGRSAPGAVVSWELCDVHGPCSHYTLDVTERAAPLRVVMDQIDSTSRFGIRIRPPAGSALPIVFDPTTDRSADNLATGSTRLEITYANPPVGRWEITVAHLVVPVGDSFRMKASLGTDGTPGPGDRLRSLPLRLLNPD